MKCDNIKEAFGLHCEHVAEDLLYLETALTLSDDGALLGAYVQDIGRGKIRITDNAATLFEALSAGVSPNAKRGRKLAEIAGQHGISLSDTGEIFTTCENQNAPYHFARYVEAVSAVSAACSGWKPQPASEFEKYISKVLKSAFRNRIKRNFEVIGASGHQLKFHLAFDAGKPTMTLIQTVASADGKPNWNTVYSTVGKMLDVKNSMPSVRRVVIIEPGEGADIERASTALAECAGVHVFRNEENLIKRVAA